MSDRIEHLLHMANHVDHKQYPAGIRDHHRVSVRLAKMIVSQCIDQIRQQYKFAQSSTIDKSEYWKGFIECGEFSVDAIERHFGIKVPDVPILQTVVDERDTVWGQLAAQEEQQEETGVDTTWDVTHFDELSRNAETTYSELSSDPTVFGELK